MMHGPINIKLDQINQFVRLIKMQSELRYALELTTDNLLRIFKSNIFFLSFNRIEIVGICEFV